jgi:hypothetical protein
MRGELCCCHVSHGPRRAVDHRNKERLSCPSHAGMQLGSRVFKARSCVIEATVDVQAATVCPYSAASVQLTTPEHGYRGDTT